MFGWMPQRDAGVDDRAQREHADCADRAGEGHLTEPFVSRRLACAVHARSVRYNGGFRRTPKTRHSTVWPSTISRTRSPGCPSSPGSICTSTRPARRSTSARRGRCATACATIWAPTASSPKTDALLDEVARLEVIVTDSVVEALALENNLIKQRTPKYNILLRDDKNYPVPAADDQRGVPARAGGAPRRARRQLLRRPVPAGALRAQDDGADAPAVRHPLVQRGDHRQARPARASSTTSSAASRRASTRSARRSEYGARGADDAAVPRGQERRARRRRCSGRMLDGRRRRAVRGGGAAARRDADGADAARSAAEDGDGRARRIATCSA